MISFSEDGVEARGGGQVLGAGGEHHRAADRPQSGHGDDDEDVYSGVKITSSRLEEKYKMHKNKGKQLNAVPNTHNGQQYLNNSPS